MCLEKNKGKQMKASELEVRVIIVHMEMCCCQLTQHGDLPQSMMTSPPVLLCVVLLPRTTSVASNI
jgi:hypothetical protein